MVERQREIVEKYEYKPYSPYRSAVDRRAAAARGMSIDEFIDMKELAESIGSSAEMVKAISKSFGVAPSTMGPRPYKSAALNHPSTEHFSEIKMPSNFDPFRVFPEFMRDLEKLKADNERQGKYNYTDHNGNPKYLLDDKDHVDVLDPLSQALWKSTNEFMQGVTEYISPYTSAISIEEATVLGEKHSRYLIKLGSFADVAQNRNVLAERRLDIKDVKRLKTKGISGVYEVYDEMIQEYESNFNKKTKRRIELEIEDALKTNGMGADKHNILVPLGLNTVQLTYFFNNLDLTATGVLAKKGISKAAKEAKERKKKMLVCPDHGNPMLRTKADPNHFYCNVVGCKRVLKRKDGVEVGPTEPGAKIKIDIDQDAANNKMVAAANAKAREQEVEAAKLKGWQIEPSHNVTMNMNIACGHLPSSPYFPVMDAVRIHREGGFTYLVQRNPDGTDSRICLVEGSYDLKINQGYVDVTSMRSAAPQFIQGYTDVELKVHGIHVE